MRISDQFDLCAACFSSDPARADASAREQGIAAQRSYHDYLSMAQCEAERDDGIEAVIIVTPNDLHFPVACAFLEAGMHVICDKHLRVTYNYTGYPMVREARARVMRGDLGTIRAIQVEYSQDWLATAIEREGQKQASWRTDPTRAGAAGCLGDIGVHAFNLLQFITGLVPERIAAHLHSFVEGRVLDDHAQIWMRFAQGARANMLCSQIAVGKENHLRIQVFGDRGALDWCQESPNHLMVSSLNGDTQRCSRGRHHIDPTVQSACLIPAGHPEGYLEAFALLYSDIATALRTKVATTNANAALCDMQFIEACLASNKADNAWVDFS